jgi:CheY-like chemotaxis protein
MPTGGTLRIETANAAPPGKTAAAGPGDEGDWVSLSVADTGCGMPPDVKDRIFEPFFTTKASGKGTGLGLSMVYGVVTQSGGSIAVESERGHGTRFTICFPAVEQTAAAARPESQQPLELRGHETILLVEDDTPIRELVRKVLSAYGYSVLEAPDGAAAIALGERHRGPVHLLLSDIGIPHVSGPEVAQRLIPLRPEMRVLYMTGFAARLSITLGVLSPAVGVLRKPFTPERLAAKVRESLTAKPGAAAPSLAAGHRETAGERAR